MLNVPIHECYLDHAMPSCAHVQVYMFSSLLATLVMCMHTYPNHIHVSMLVTYPCHEQASMSACMFIIR